MSYFNKYLHVPLKTITGLEVASGAYKPQDNCKRLLSFEHVSLNEGALSKKGVMFVNTNYFKGVWQIPGVLSCFREHTPAHSMLGGFRPAVKYYDAKYSVLQEMRFLGNFES